MSTHERVHTFLPNDLDAQTITFTLDANFGLINPRCVDFVSGKGCEQSCILSSMSKIVVSFGMNKSSETYLNGALGVD